MFSVEDVGSEVKNFGSLIPSCINLKERVFFMFISDTVYSIVYALALKWVII